MPISCFSSARLEAPAVVLMTAGRHSLVLSRCGTSPLWSCATTRPRRGSTSGSPDMARTRRSASLSPPPLCRGGPSGARRPLAGAADPPFADGGLRIPRARPWLPLPLSPPAVLVKAGVATLDPAAAAAGHTPRPTPTPHRPQAWLHSSAHAAMDRLFHTFEAEMRSRYSNATLRTRMCP